jgi:beta-N-acetylhexosaminidase
MNFRNLDLLNTIFLILLLLSSLLPAFSQDELDLKIGQMIMVSFAPGTGFEDTLYYDIEHRNLGGIILFGYNLQNPVQITNLTSDLQNSATIPLFIATDQEGGIVARLDENNGFAETHTAYQLGTVIDNEDSTRNQAKLMAQWLFDSGINTNLAPVVDVNVNPSSPAIGYYERSFSVNPLKVFNHADWFISEFENFNLISTLKHFPGHGSAEQDSHLGFTDVTTTWADSELVPYRELISAGYSDIIMVGHLYNAHIDSIYPASLSENVITGFLRDSLGFQGVVTSDAMFMRAITDNYSFEEAIVLAVNAGTDLLLYTSNEYNGSSLVAEVTRVIRKSIDEGVILQNQIEESYQRIMALKSKITGLASKTGKSIPEVFSLHIYPNPFNITTNIEISISRAGSAEMEIFDVRGRRLYYNRYPWLSVGKHTVTFDAASLSSGIYFLKFEVSGFSLVRKITLIK